ncbi:hypothetical protein KKC16_01505 [Patescibacteria group bacterium]|nr:hypothetical protein [Patescibacteria group bacterium]MBU4482110.1 hypothetical protein [Patescibacteria group bacterium]
MQTKKLKYHHKIFFIVLIIFIFLVILSIWDFGDDKEIVWGATFSKKQAELLNLDWKLVYKKTLDEMNFKILRIPFYWDEIETQPNEYNFADYVWMINQAANKNIEIVPVIGRRVPRWPECHTPKFYQDMPENEIKEKIFALLTQEIKFFKNYENIKKWQLENEPFADFFGQCPIANKKIFQEEIDYVKMLDTSRQILVTESGELSSWKNGARLGDILGISMYRQTWNKKWGWFNYPLAPAYYHFKAQLVKLLTGNKEIINTELQVEPWAFENDLSTMDIFDQFYSMDLNQVKENIRFAKRAGFQENYLWGIEWWWWLGQKHGNWEFWEFGKTLIHTNKNTD